MLVEKQQSNTGFQIRTSEFKDDFFYAESGESDTLKDSDFMKITRDFR